MCNWPGMACEPHSDYLDTRCKQFVAPTSPRDIIIPFILVVYCHGVTYPVKCKYRLNINYVHFGCTSRSCRVRVSEWSRMAVAAPLSALADVLMVGLHIFRLAGPTHPRTF